MTESLSELISAAESRIAEFDRLVDGIPYERKGILNSEMFFLWLCAQTARPKRVLESGRARGQSTLILARCFPDAEIISVEHDRDSPDVPVAEERLRDEANVTLLFGDATRLLVDLAQPGDIALIDGPKGFRGVRFALSLLGTGRLPLVFVHDTGPGTAERSFFEKALSAARYSDEPGLVLHSHRLDDENATDIPPEHRYAAVANRTGYGYGLACLPHDPAIGYRMLSFRSVMAALQDRFSRRSSTSD